MYRRNCRLCAKYFETKSPYALVCSNTCRDVSAKKSRKKYKKTAHGIELRRTWQQSQMGKEMRARHRRTPKAKATAVRRITRLVKENPYYRSTKNLRTLKAYRELRTKLIAQFAMCAACHSESDLTIDHVIPMSIGGKHEVENLQVLCRSCNSRKKQEVIRYAVPQVQQTIN